MCKRRSENRPRHAVRAGDAAEEKWTAGSWFHERLWREPGSWDTGGMYTVEIYGRVRRAVLVEGKSERAVAQEFGIARETVRKMLRYSVPPGYRRERPVKRPKLGPWIGGVDGLLGESKKSPARARDTREGAFGPVWQGRAPTGR